MPGLRQGAHTRYHLGRLLSFSPRRAHGTHAFFGLVPMRVETSDQAQFRIPAAILISFGLAFGALITLTLLPVILHHATRTS